MKYIQKHDFSDPYFTVYGQNRIRIFPYLDRVGDFDQIRENTYLILSIYAKIRIREMPYFGKFHTVFMCYVTASFEEERQYLEN